MKSSDRVVRRRRSRSKTSASAAGYGARSASGGTAKRQQAGTHLCKVSRLVKRPKTRLDHFAAKWVDSCKYWYNAFFIKEEGCLMENVKLIIARNIASLRKANHLTQTELAARLNYSDKAVSKWERGDSVPDVVVLKEIADLFGVTLDYLVQAEHPQETRPTKLRQLHNHGFILGMCIMLVWLLAVVVFAAVNMANPGVETASWLAFVAAVPVSMIVWLIFNSIWFNPRRNFLIVSLLMWTLLGAVYVTCLAFGSNPWLLFLIGVPGQIIIAFASRLRYKNRTVVPTDDVPEIKSEEE